MADNSTTVIIRARDETAAAFRSASAGMAQMQNALGSLDGAMGKLPALGAVLAGTLGMASFTGAIKGAISFAAALDDMAEKTGASVEHLSALAGVAKIGGHDLGMVEGSLIKLAKALQGTGEDGDKAARALKAIGLSQEELRGLDTAEAMQRVAKALAQYENGAGKTALAIDLLGKSGAEALPYLNDLADTGELVGKVTAEQAAMAEKYEKNMKQLEAAASGLSKVLAMEMLPTLTSLTEQMNASVKNSGGFWSGLVQFFSISGDAAQKPAEEIEKIDAKLKVMRADMEALSKPTWANAINDIVFGDVGDLQKQIAFLETRRKILADIQAAQAAPAGGEKKSLADYRTGVVKEDGPKKDKKAKERREELAVFDDASSIMAVLKANEAIEKARESSAASLADLQEKFAAQNRAAADAMAIMPEAERRLAEQIGAVGDSAQKTRDDLTKHWTAGTLSLDEYMAKLQDLAAIEAEQIDAVRALAAKQAELNASWDYGQAKALTAYTENVKNEAKTAEEFVTASFGAMEDALAKFIMTGKLDFKSFTAAIVAQLAKIAAAKMVAGIAGNLFGGSGDMSDAPRGVIPQADGGAWLNGVQAFANGGAFTNRLFNQPTMFKFAKGLGVMGEAGPEAVMPLTRDSQGRLGVRADGAGSGGNVFNVSVAVDATGGKTQGDAGAANDLGRKIETAVRGVLVNEMRPGGLLAA